MVMTCPICKKKVPPNLKGEQNRTYFQRVFEFEKDELICFHRECYEQFKTQERDSHSHINNRD